MTIALEDLREWLDEQYDGYSVEPEPAKGTYGLIWFLNAKSPNTLPGTFAVKTVDPNRVSKVSKTDDVANLRREFRMWLALPTTHNVLPAFGFDIAHFTEREGNQTINLPFMRMPRMAGSLETWVSKPSAAEVADRLIALAQSLNGLQYLYDHGFQGHGDLKPSNLLYDDMRSKFQVSEGETWPSTAHPWRIRVADLGWADAWVDLGFSNKVLRTHMAPERLDGIVVPVKSDIFSMGIIAAELLQGQHPAENLNARAKSEGAWRKWATGGTRNLTGVNSTKLQAVIQKCLCASPDLRPDALEFLNEICCELRTNFGLDVAKTLQLWRSGVVGDDPVANNEQYAWAAKQSPRLGAHETEASLVQISEKLWGIDVVDFKSCEEWAPLAEALVHLVTANHERQSQIRKLASEHLVKILGRLDRNEVVQLGVRGDWPTLRPFERYAMLVGALADIAELEISNDSDVVRQLESYAKSTLYYHLSSKYRSTGHHKSAIAVLSDAISESPSEPTYYYFRARWRNEYSILHKVLASRIDPPENYSMDDIATDLERAIELEPNWEEPKRLLGSLQRKSR
jgi:hypothetical protein